MILSFQERNQEGSEENLMRAAILEERIKSVKRAGSICLADMQPREFAALGVII